jgi:hypothetical protein
LALWDFFSLSQSVEAGGWIYWHHGKSVWQVTQPTTTQSIMLVPTAATTQLSYTPVTQLHVGTLTTGQSLQLSTGQSLQQGTGQSLQLVPTTNAPLTLTQGLTASTGTLTTANMTLQGTNSPVVLTLCRQGSNNVVGVSAAPNGGTDVDSQVVALGLALGGGNKSLGDFTKFLEDQAVNLFQQAGSNASQQAIADRLFDIAMGFLSGNGFGILIDNAVAPIIKRMIGKVVQRVQPSQPSQPANPYGPVIPVGGASFEISGRITLTPTQGQQVPSTQPSRPQSGTMPVSLTPDGGQVAPSP